MKKTLIMLSILTFMASSCKQTALKDGETYVIWEQTTLHETFLDENGFEVCQTSTYSYADYKFIKSLPKPVKTIIACYSASDETILMVNTPQGLHTLSQALGNFATLDEARQTLSKNWSGEKPFWIRYPVTLKLKKMNQSYFFEVYEPPHQKETMLDIHYIRHYTDEFIIEKCEKITYQGSTHN